MKASKAHAQRDADRGAAPQAMAESRLGRLGGKLTNRRIGIGFRLFAAFGAVAFLTLIATGIAWYSFANVGSVLHQVTGRSVPAMTGALRLAASSASLSAEAPALVAARDDSERQQQNVALVAKIEAMTAALADLRRSLGQANQLEAVAELTQQSTDNLATLDGAVAEMLRLRVARTEKLAEISR